MPKIKYGLAIWDNALKKGYTTDKAIIYWELGETK